MNSTTGKNPLKVSSAQRAKNRLYGAAVLRHLGVDFSDPTGQGVHLLLYRGRDRIGEFWPGMMKWTIRLHPNGSWRPVSGVGLPGLLETIGVAYDADAIAAAVGPSTQEQRHA